ncbi:LysR family transcriptional regulator [Paraburkholderia unamae]|uniref:LysR family transcriptional regulator n=1 Tax=Paraburkholderia unamae TaxID=219649 RepID=UPI001CC7CA12|nr:LysR family transcriptional regulator [Paraburkholderia unamae]
MNEIRAITVFLRAATLGSLRKAAADLGIAPQAASLALAQLEQHLDLRLFHRTTRSLSLTEAGERFLGEVQPAHEGLLKALADARRGKETMAGPLRVSAPQSLGKAVLWPFILRFRERYPEVALDLQFDDRFSDWIADRIDVGFRGGLPADGRLIARRLMPVQLIVCASPDYVAQRGAPQHIDELVNHACTGYRQPNTGRVAPWVFRVGKETVYRDVPTVLCTNEPELETDAVASGVGIGQLGSFSAVPLIRTGRLLPLLTHNLSDDLGLYICYARRAQMPLRARTFIDFMVDALAGNTGWVLTREELAAANSASAASAAKRRPTPRKSASGARRSA